ncbi:YceI family protein [Mucilaginibacter sabulilitoris]|uniref:YceI family protein n=1 Tax=Mucilaginibacter sabulilitoris TaxID=1173583 RepID=A0ABZ0TU54_9SPHI|nr:YceI family protein [Mucilaginibacter sabulilitoris]WPU96617.1 YceI family protein [Mucilaginibacter sabulilitoris]
MKKIMYPMLIVLFVSFSAFIAVTTWKVKEPYEIKFANGRIHGEFTGLKANIQFDKAHPEESKISASIDVNTLSTGFFIKTSHAKDALDADNYPTISFTSTGVTKTANGYDANGKLTLKGVTKPVTIHFTFDDKGNEGVFKGDFRVIPKDFNITKNGTPDDLAITLNVPVTK